MTNMVIGGVYAPHLKLFQNSFKAVRNSAKSSTINEKDTEIVDCDENKLREQGKNRRDKERSA